MRTEEAIITPDVMKWARERVMLDYAKVARRVSTKISPELVEKWESGDERPTMAQAQRIAKALYVPFGYLFLSKRPKDALPISDFRTLGGERPAVTGNLIDLINSVLFKQDWYRDFLLYEGSDPLGFVGSYGNNVDNPVALANEIRAVLGLTMSLRESCADSNELMRELVKRAEAAGILVMRSRHVDGHRNRRLQIQVERFRGFAISDRVAPLVFINTDDAKSAQLFTLGHELAHIWIGDTGISNTELDALTATAGRNELFCNAVSAELLVSSDEISQAWQPRLSDYQNVASLRNIFKVSMLVSIRRAFDTGRISRDSYREMYLVELSKSSSAEPDSKKKKKGNAVTLSLMRNSNTFSRALIGAARRGLVSYRDAGMMLNLLPETIRRLSDKL